MRKQGSLVRQWLLTAAPTLIVAVPLVGLSLQGDERRRLYRSAHHYSGNPIKSARSALRNVDAYLDAGNFRPIGRFAEGLQHGVVLEASELTGMAPHTTLGVVRLTMVLALSLICAQIVAALARSAGLTRPKRILALYPLALGTVLVANGHSGALAQFSFVFIGAVAVILATALAVARDADMEIRGLRWHEPVTMSLLGAATAMTYDLVYAAPAVALAYGAARAGASRMPLRDSMRTAAARRWAALAVGFLAVFIPVRIVIAQRCGQGSCYQGSELGLSSDVAELAASRSLTATPIEGWSHNASIIRDSGGSLGLPDLFTTSLPALLVLAIVAATAGAAVRMGAQPSTARGPLGNTPGDEEGTDGRRAWTRLAAALVALGTVTVVLAALVGSLSRWAQQTRPPTGQAWRETLLGQVGWSLVILGVLAMLLGLIRSPAVAKAAGVGACALLGACLTLTLLANSRLAVADRHDQVSAITDQIASETVNVDTTSGGNARRCELIDRYTELVPPHLWIAGPGLRADLDDLMVGRYGWPFCDPARKSEAGQ
ncbi:MAG: hypothetical protein J4F50_00105 [Acidimicrobiia bacterium]|nr:hypothetical protein [Acidimicrobiia bacterium]